MVDRLFFIDAGSTGNIALGHKTAQSSIYESDHSTSLSELAVDGSRDAVYKKVGCCLHRSGSCTHTKKEDSSFWYVNLGRTRLVSSVVIYNRDEFSELIFHFCTDTSLTMINTLT